MANVQYMDLMFLDAIMVNQDISAWNLTSVVELGGVLIGARKF